MTRRKRSALARLVMDDARRLGFLADDGGGDGGGDAAGGDAAGGDGGTGDAASATGDAGTGDVATDDAGTGDVATGDAGTGDVATGDAGTGDALGGDSAPAPGDPGGGAAPASTADAPPGTVADQPALTDPEFISNHFVGSRDWAKDTTLIEQVSGASLYGWYQSSAVPMRERIYSTYYAPLAGRIPNLIEPDYFARVALREQIRLGANGYTEASNTAAIELQIVGLYLNQPALVAARGRTVNVYEFPRAQAALANGQAAADARWQATQDDDDLFSGALSFAGEFLHDVGPGLTVIRIGSMIYSFGASEGFFAAAEVAATEGAEMALSDVLDFSAENFAGDFQFDVPLDVDPGLESFAGDFQFDVPIDAAPGVENFAGEYTFTAPETFASPETFAGEYTFSDPDISTDSSYDFSRESEYGPGDAPGETDFTKESDYGPGERPDFTDERAPGETPGTTSSPWPNVSASNLSTAFSALRSLFADNPQAGRLALSYLNSQLAQDGRPGVSERQFMSAEQSAQAQAQAQAARERTLLMVRGGAGAAPVLNVPAIARTLQANALPLAIAGGLAIWLYQRRDARRSR